MKDLISDLRWRGLLQDRTPDLEERLAQGPVTGYVGFDPTASSLQIGNLVPVMLLVHLQRAGGRPIVLVGGGTGLIGDPSGKRSERPLLDRDMVEEHAARQRVQLQRFLDYDHPERGARTVNNLDWLDHFSLIEFLRDYGKHFTVSYMMQKESVKSRLDSGISFTEFSYMLMQAYDFLHLFREYHCELQLGGSDQWGNITAGVELIRRVTGARAHGLSAPLITTDEGGKFGKTEEGSIWLDPDLTSPYRFYQFWINIDDESIADHVKLFSLKGREEIEALLEDHRRNPAARLPQRALATELTERVHGEDVAASVLEASKLMFHEADLTAASPSAWQTLERELQVWETKQDDLPMALVDLLTKSGLLSSKGEAKRQLKQGGIYLNDKRMSPEATVSTEDCIRGSYLWLRRGKKTDLLVKVLP